MAKKKKTKVKAIKNGNKPFKAAKKTNKKLVVKKPTKKPTKKNIKKAISKASKKPNSKSQPKSSSARSKDSLGLVPAKAKAALKKVIESSPLHLLSDEDSTASLVLKRIREALSPSHLSLKNNSAAHKKHKESKRGGGGHYILSVVSEVFAGLDLKSRQQWVMTLLKDQIGSTIHALQLELKAPAEVPLLKDSGAPPRKDFKIKADSMGSKKAPAKHELKDLEKDEHEISSDSLDDDDHLGERHDAHDDAGDEEDESHNNDADDDSTEDDEAFDE